jgi:hypothetical protein
MAPCNAPACPKCDRPASSPAVGADNAAVPPFTGGGAPRRLGTPTWSCSRRWLGSPGPSSSRGGAVGAPRRAGPGGLPFWPGEISKTARPEGPSPGEGKGRVHWLLGSFATPGVTRTGLDHRFGHCSRRQAADRFRVERGAAGRAGTSSRSRTYSNRSWGLVPKNRSAAVVPSGRRIRELWRIVSTFNLRGRS